MNNKDKNKTVNNSNNDFNFDDVIVEIEGEIKGELKASPDSGENKNVDDSLGVKENNDDIEDVSDNDSDVNNDMDDISDDTENDSEIDDDTENLDANGNEDSLENSNEHKDNTPEENESSDTSKEGDSDSEGNKDNAGSNLNKDNESSNNSGESQNNENTDSNSENTDETKNKEDNSNKDNAPENSNENKEKNENTPNENNNKKDKSENTPNKDNQNKSEKPNDNKPQKKDDNKNSKSPKSALDKKRDDLKNKWNNRPKNPKEMMDRAKNGIKNGAKNRFNNSKAGQAINKGKNAVEKGKKAVQTAKKAGKAAAKAGKAAAKATQGLLKLFISALPWSAIILGAIALIIGIIVLVSVLTPGVGGDVNDDDNYSKYEKVDQETLDKLKKIFAKYPNADGTLAMATVLYPYFDNLQSGNVASILEGGEDYKNEDDNDEDGDVSESDEDNEDITDENEDSSVVDPYLYPFRKAKIRRKLKRVLKELNNSNKDGFRKYLMETYFNNDKGYSGFDEEIFTGYNGYKEMINSVESTKKDELIEEIIDDLYEKKDLFIDYVYENKSCSVSYQSAGTVEIDELLKSNILVDVKVESCTTSKDIQNCESKYDTPITLDKYIMSVTYEEIGVSANSDVERVKAQMVAAKSFALSRWKTMGWNTTKTDDGSYIIPIRSNTNDQDFCDIDTGCADKINGAKRPAIDEATRALMTNAWEDTKNLFIYDNQSGKTTGSYCANRTGNCNFCQKGSCLSHDELSNYTAGTLYSTILGEQYSSLSLITIDGDFASIAVPGEVTCTSGALGSAGVPDELFKYYYQTDYPDVAFCGAQDWMNGCYSNPTGKNTICTSGCGVTSLAMVVSTLSDENLDPVNANNEALSRGACNVGVGSYNTLFTEISNNHSGFTYENVEVSKNGADDIIKALKNGALVVANVQQQSPFTNGGHWIVLRGIASNGEVKVADPFSKEKTKSNTYNIYDFVDKNWLVDSNGNKHSWYIIYGPKSPDFATKISTTGDPGVATGYLGNPTDPDNTSKSYANDGNSSSFPKYKNGNCHGGVDLSMKEGTSIYAMDGGVVSVTGNYNSNCYNKKICNSGWNSYGIYVTIDHQNGYKTVYAHLSSKLVNDGDIISKGQLIGNSGNTGSSSGPHLHVELQKTDLLNVNGRNSAKCEIGKGLINPTMYINSETTYVGQSQ